MKKKYWPRVEVLAYTTTKRQQKGIDSTMYYGFSEALSTSNITFKIGDIIHYLNIPYRIKDISGTKESPVLYVDPEK